MGQAKFFYVFRLITIVVLAHLTFLSGFVTAEESTLSPAEQAALDAQSPIDDTYLINLCHHTLLYGSQEDKAAVLERLGDQTCAEAVVNGSTNDNAADGSE